jgi:hypothetical protein
MLKHAIHECENHKTTNLIRFFTVELGWTTFNWQMSEVLKRLLIPLLKCEI